MDSNEQESDVRKAMLRCSEEAVFLCDNTKFEKVGYVVTAQLKDFNYFITDASIPEEWLPVFSESKVKLLNAL
jgi:DeoR family fructose operon transcriptional repressor